MSSIGLQWTGDLPQVFPCLCPMEWTPETLLMDKGLGSDNEYDYDDNDNEWIMNR